MSSYLTSRGKARRRAVDIIFEAAQRRVDVESILTVRTDRTDQIINPLTRQIVVGVQDSKDQIDEILSTYAQGWTLERMPAVDLAILRVGAWELLCADEKDVPEEVAMHEAVKIAEEYSTDESPTFINGILGRIQSMKSTLRESMGLSSQED